MSPDPALTPPAASVGLAGPCQGEARAGSAARERAHRHGFHCLERLPPSRAQPGAPYAPVSRRRTHLITAFPQFLTRFTNHLVHSYPRASPPPQPIRIAATRICIRTPAEVIAFPERRRMRHSSNAAASAWARATAWAPRRGGTATPEELAGRLQTGLGRAGRAWVALGCEGPGSA